MHFLLYHEVGDDRISKRAQFRQLHYLPDLNRRLDQLLLLGNLATGINSPR